jgi:hypothetical protein
MTLRLGQKAQAQMVEGTNHAELLHGRSTSTSAKSLHPSITTLWAS